MEYGEMREKEIVGRKRQFVFLLFGIVFMWGQAN